jgi:hypothetical protein
MGVAHFLALVAVGHTGASFDAEAHRLEAPGAAAADLRAPTAAIARVKAERAAKAQAAARLKAALEQLGVKQDLDKLLGGASVVDERYGSDGSVELKLRLSTEGLDVKR